MRISDVSIKNPVMAWMIMGFFMIFGAISFSRLGISQFPDVDFPTVNVSVGLSGASPEIIETNVVEPLEDVLTTVEGIKSLDSSSRSGRGNVSIEFDLDRSIDAALQEVQTKVSQAQRRLPKDIDPPVISKSNPDDQPILWLGVVSKAASDPTLSVNEQKNARRELMKYTQEYLKDQITTVTGVGDVTLGGFSDPVLRVQVQPEKLKKFNVTILDVIEAIKSEHAELPGGQVDNAKLVYNVRVKGEASTLADFQKIIISRRAGQSVADPSQRVRLTDVANVELDLADSKQISRFNGQISVGMGVKKQRGTNAVAVARAVKDRMAQLQKNLPPGFEFKVNFDSTLFIERSIAELNKHLLLAVLLTAFVCWVFLGSFSATVNVLLSIPTSILGTFIALYFLGFTLNTFTLLGLTLAIGIVVDDAIMVLENIFRYKEKGRNQIESAIIGSREITFAALAATAAVIAIFLPVVFMKGIIGKFFLQFGITISFAVFLSLIESLTITPMRCASFVSHSERTTKIGLWFDRVFDQFQKFYSRQLNWCLNRIALTVILAFVVMFASFGLMRFIPKEFTPAQESGLLMARMQMKTGTAFTETNEKAVLVEKWLMKNPNVLQVFSSIGGGFGGGSDANTAMMFISMKPKKERPNSQEEFSKTARDEIKKLIGSGRISLQDPTSRGFGGGGRGFPIEFAMKGPDWNALSDQAEQMMESMKSSGLMVDVDSNMLTGLPEIQIIPNREKSASSGITISTVAQTINAMISGVVAGQYADGGKRYDIRVDLEKTTDQTKSLENILVSNVKGNFLPLSSIVQFEKQKTLQQINRSNRQRTISLYANIEKGVKAEKAKAFIEESKLKVLKPGYIIENNGSSQSQTEAFSGLVIALVLGLVVAYMILASQFNSFLDPVTILMALPFSIGGAFMGLLITGQTLNIYSMIGVLLLMGIVKKNSILLVEFANQVRDQQSISALEAMKLAGAVRLRPILMTSFATVAGAIPTAIATGEGAELTRSMAITLISGVLVSTFLTLVVIPAIYVVFDKFKTQQKNQLAVKLAFENAGQEGL